MRKMLSLRHPLSPGRGLPRDATLRPVPRARTVPHARYTPRPWRVLLAGCLVVAGLSAAFGCASPGGSSVSTPAVVTTGRSTTTAPLITTPVTNSVTGPLLEEVRTLLADLDAGRIVIDWPPPEATIPEDSFFAQDAGALLVAVEKSLLGPDVTASLKDAAAGQVHEFAHEVAAWPGVARAEPKTKEEVLAQLRQDLADRPEVLERLEDNPLPAELYLWLSDPASSEEAVAERLGADTRIDEVRHGRESSRRLVDAIKIYVRRVSPSTNG